MQDEDMIESLLKQAGRRKEPAADTASEIQAATYAAWQAAVRSHARDRRRKIFGISGIAACLVVALAVGMLGRMQQDVNPMAFVAQVNGNVQINSRLVDQAQNIAPTQVANIGDDIRTEANSSVTVELTNGIKLILGENSELKLSSLEEVYLKTGRLYFDSQNENTSLKINTQQGSIVDIGTQYEVKVDDDGMRISMREGEVSLLLAGKMHTASANDGVGDILEINKSHKVSRSSLRSTDDYWLWVLKASNDINLEGKSVYDVLDQIARLTGRTVVYKNANAKRIAKETRLSGGSLDPEYIESSLPLLLNTTTLIASLQSEYIEVDSSLPSQ